MLSIFIGILNLTIAFFLYKIYKRDGQKDFSYWMMHANGAFGVLNLIVGFLKVLG